MTTDQHPQNLVSILDQCARDIAPILPLLDKVIKEREDRFLHLGATVFEINSKAGAFSGKASAMAQSAGEGALREAIAELGRRADEAKAVFATVSTEQQLTGMAEVLLLIKGLEQAMQQFGTMVRTLKVLEITTRIESARLGNLGTGFTTLADDVKSLAAKIIQNTDKIRDHTFLLERQVGSAREQGQKQLRRQEELLQGMFAELYSGISDLEGMRAHSAGLVRELADGSRQVTESMGQVIASVQFHDITRQQVEHVEEILEQAMTETSSAADTDPAGMASWVRDVLRLQAPQLGQAREMFCRAVDDLIASLDSIADNVAGLDQKISSVAYADDGRGASVLDAIRAHIRGVVQAMQATSDQVAEASRAMSHMAETIAKVSTFVDDIEDIGTEIELIALNASVKAAHTGEQGRALGVLAVEIQHLSMAARSHTGKVSDTLQRISRVADDMTRLAGSCDVAEMASEIQSGFEAVLTRLAELDQELRDNTSHLSQLGSVLVGEIRATSRSIDFHHQVSRELQDLETMIHNLESRFAPHAAELDQARQPEKLRDQLARYTMDSERLVHLAVLGHAAQDGHGAGDDSVDLFDDVELFGDDNVELFGDDNVELFDQSETADAAAGPPAESSSGDPDDDLGDNVELF